MLIEVAEKHPAQAGKKVATVIAAGGDTFQIWPEQLASIQVGSRYEVEVTDREYNGRVYHKITKATAVSLERPSGNGARQAHSPNKGSGNGNGYYRATSPQDSERMFVCSLLNAFIQAGQIEPNEEQVVKAIEVLRRAYRRTFGEDGR
jgi:hypothetical protein